MCGIYLGAACGPAYFKSRVYGSQGESKALRTYVTMANLSPVGKGKPLKAFKQGNLKAQREDK